MRRICLSDYNPKHNESCSKIYRCTQCHLDHFSLDADCKVIKQYCNNLNRAVKQATEEGTIKPTVTEALHAPAPRPIINNQVFSPLPISSSHSSLKHLPWKTTNSSSLSQHHPTDISNQQLFEKICAHPEEKSKLVDTRRQKIENEVESNRNLFESLRQNLSSTIRLLNSLITELVSPMSKAISNLDEKS